MEAKRVLIVGTVPYRNDSTSRAYDSYFHNMPRTSLAQIFSNPKVPVMGHCDSLFQITDKMLLKRWINVNTTVGKIYHYNQLNKESSQALLGTKNSNIINKLYYVGAKHTPLTHLLRALLWRKKYWCTKTLNDWLKDFEPECVFLSFSNDFFILRIALYIAQKFDIPIVSVVGDDYYFSKKRTISPFYYIYKLRYRELVDCIFKKYVYAIYISDKIRDKYNNYFKIKGETVYLASKSERRDFKKININNPKINYFGNIDLDRYLSLIDIANALERINHNYRIEIYSVHITVEIRNKLSGCKNIVLHEAVPYDEVIKLTLASDIILLVEGFTEYNINSTRYSLSTKVADSLQSGVNIFAYGSRECGLIEYLTKYDACFVCTEKNELSKSLLELMKREEVQKKYYFKSLEIVEKHHSIEVSTRITRSVINNAVGNWNKLH